MLSKVWDEITYQFPNFNGNYFSMLGIKLIHVSRRGPWKAHWKPNNKWVCFTQTLMLMHALNPEIQHHGGCITDKTDGVMDGQKDKHWTFHSPTILFLSPGTHQCHISRHDVDFQRLMLIKGVNCNDINTHLLLELPCHMFPGKSY